MKLLKPTYLLRTLLLLCAVAVVSSACERNETQSLSDKLDHMIANRQVYDCQKEQRIAELRHLLSVSGLTPAQEYEINDRLFGEFHKYKLDSAIRYMERNVLLARRLGDRRKGCLSGIRLAELYSSTGMSIEAKRMLDSIDRRSVPRDMLATYYKAYNRFYQQYVAFSGQRHFRELEERYQDSVIMFADTVSVRYKLDRLYQMSRRNQSHEMEVRLLGFLNSLEPDSQLYAECAYSVGSFYRRRGDDWLARKYYMLSAMTDIRNSTKENAAFQALATLYYRHDDLFRAFRYTQAAVEDALFSNVQFRTVQMSELYSIIIASHQAKESRTKHKLQYYLVLISVLSAVLVLLSSTCTSSFAGSTASRRSFRRPMRSWLGSTRSWARRTSSCRTPMPSRCSTSRGSSTFAPCTSTKWTITASRSRSWPRTGSSTNSTDGSNRPRCSRTSRTNSTRISTPSS